MQQAQQQQQLGMQPGQRQEPGMQPARPAKEQFVWTKQWYPAMPLSYLDPTRPTPITLLNKPLVLWRDGAGEWRCFQDACPHRLAPLSEGRIEADGTLMCSYHGWRFDSDGACTRIPQAEDEKAAAVACGSKRSCVTSYPVTKAGGLLWVWPDASSNAAEESARSTPKLPKGVETCLDQGGTCEFYMRDLPYSYDILLENLTDPSHLPFSHHRLSPTLTRDKAIPLPMRTAPGPEPSQPRPEFMAAADPEWAVEFPSQRGAPGNWDSTLLFNAPGGVVYNDKLGPNNSSLQTTIFAVPTQPGSSRVFVAGFTLPVSKLVSLWDVAKAALSPKAMLVFWSFIQQRLPIWVRHQFSNKLFDQDGVFLAMQEQRLRRGGVKGASGGGGPTDWAKAYYMPTGADKSVINVRRWIDCAGSPYQGGASASERREATRREMLDRYEQHTKHCLLCKRQLLKIQDFANATLAVGAALFCALCGVVARGFTTGSWATALGVVAALGAAVCAGLYSAARQLTSQFHFTDFSHADNH